MQRSFEIVLQAGNNSEQGRFAAAIGTDNTKLVVGLNFECWDLADRFVSAYQLQICDLDY
jgi:hypothetical protein